MTQIAPVFQKKLKLFALILILTAGLSHTLGASESPVSFDQALQDAKNVASMNDNWQIMEAEGNSMDPYYSANSLLIVDKIKFSELTVGMIAIYKDDSGELVGHTVTESHKQGNTYTAKGYNNPNTDPGKVTKDNFIGVLFAIFNYQSFSRNTMASHPIVYGKTY